MKFPEVLPSLQKQHCNVTFMEITLYHGSEKIVERPLFGVGRPTTDYGSGFYCTENCELAKE